MPVYDYQCNKCEHVFEEEHAMSFTGKVKCPSCGSVRTVKIFNPAGVHFKGSGFYVTDSSKSRAAANSNNGTKDITPEKSTDTEKKPAKTKKESKTTGNTK